MANVLIIDDDEIMQEILATLVARLGHRVSRAFTLKEGLDRKPGEFDVVFLDIHLPDGNGLAALPLMREGADAPEVIIITGYGSTDGAELAVKNGAWDYIEKGASVDKIILTLTRAVQYRDEKKRIRAPLVALKRTGIVGDGPLMKACLDQVAQAASTDASILITGETGTGKELFAKAIHMNSHRAQGNFVTVDCTALPETLVESLLFGHEKGAFTGADTSREGLFSQANGGTLFLDEVGELPLSAQKRFLRVLQGRCFRPLGGRRETESNFRLVAATNCNLEEKVRAKEFREDLLFRLRTFAIELPPLRDRPEDIKETVTGYVSTLCEQYGMETKGFSSDFIGALTAYDWPGNVRELVNALEKAILASRWEPILYRKHLPMHIRVKLARDTIENGEVTPRREPTPGSTHDAILPTMHEFRESEIARLEIQYLKDLMLATESSIPDACRASGLSRSRLYGLLKKHRIEL